MTQFYAYLRKFREAYDGAMEPLSVELSMAQTAVELLLFLANNPETNTARDICFYLHLKPGIVSFHVENLVRDGFLERRPVPEDRRKWRLVPTEKAEPVVQRGRALQADFCDRMNRGLSEQELNLCSHCFTVFEQNLSDMAKQQSNQAKKESHNGTR
ncbi:MAG: MarR family winged helix-turn-helix transcriptional regulator [Oscillospiraceae bacterium]|nr:MarR family winged helix-turn-helix transcriptional regulator [Oscillospiraceae bacterium]